MTAAAPARPRVLADLLPGALLRDVLLVVGVAALTGLAAQFFVPLVPVPITMQTFVVLFAGAALGPWRGGAAMLLYLVAGVAGVPWFAEQGSGYAFASFGYIIGFVPAASVVGALASRGADRTVGGTVAIMVLGNLIIYAFGVPWLMASLGLPLFVGLESGLWPFVIGDALKIALAAGLLPLTWRLVGRHD
jgi:biotin transport system substrate-specific component